ncbi:hypothetical protein [Afipia sp. GAS231]|uniref:hypothetical protein n=1 Tax=Afipia sp. GAS231 TaxID=1882747 RepID=UPI00155F55B8
MATAYDPEASWLAMRGHKASLANRYVRPGIAQAGRFNIRPDLAGAISGNGMDGKPVGFGKSSDFVCFHFGSETRQSERRHTHEREYREGRKRFDHCGAADCGGSPIPLIGDRFGNEAGAAEFHKKRTANR